MENFENSFISSTKISVGQALAFANHNCNFEKMDSFVLREDWKSLTLSKALAFAEQVEFHSSLVESIVLRKDCSVEQALDLIRKAKYSSKIRILTLREDWETLPLTLTLALAEEAKYDYVVVQAIVLREDCSIEQALDLAEKANYRSEVLEVIVSRDDWETLPLTLALALTEKAEYDSTLIKGIVTRKDCSIEQALDLLRKDDYTPEVTRALVLRTDYSIDQALNLVRYWGHQDYYSDVIKAIISRINWKNLSFNETLDLVEKTDSDILLQKIISNLASMKLSLNQFLTVMNHDKLYDSILVDSIIQTQEWKALSLAEALAFAEQAKLYTSDLRNLIILRKDWKSLTLSKALALTEKAEYDSTLIKGIVSRKDCSIEQALDLVKKTDYDTCVVVRIIKRKDCSIEQALDLVKKTKFHSYVIKVIVSRNDWE